ncbi:peroxidase 44-like protein [Trifolium pratense]|uniref:peroxidase n=1 Tax=Trifolium pratense TaxID=57577 RepID=A0A2K3MUU3_TRIPR|nr:peroxidase 44-like protein [Trifolium pratense]
MIKMGKRLYVALAGGPRCNVPTGRRDWHDNGRDDYSTRRSHCLDSLIMKSRINNESFPMDRALRKKLVGFCAVEREDRTVFMDQNTSFVFDNEFYNQVLLRRGVLAIDRNLALDSISKGVVTSLLVRDRKNCRVFNP